MPTTCRCASCRFEADLGWYHHHLFDDGFAATTLLLCMRCGTRHRVQIALREPAGWRREIGPRFDLALVDVGAHRARVLGAIRVTLGCSVHDAMVRTAAMPVPLLEDVGQVEADEARARFESVGARVDVFTRPAEPIPPPIPKQKDELLAWLSPESGGEPAWQLCRIEGECRGDSGEFDLAVQCCGRCKARGTLASKLSSDVTICPLCGENAFQAQGGWIS